jgi:hypothetical protein
MNKNLNQLFLFEIHRLEQIVTILDMDYQNEYVSYLFNYVLSLATSYFKKYYQDALIELKIDPE